MVMHARTFALSLVAASAALALLGCSSSSSGSPGPGGDVTGPDTCKLVTKADVEAAFGGTVSDGMPGKDQYHCRFAISGKLTSGQTVDTALGCFVDVIWNAHVPTKGGTVTMALDPVPEFADAYYEKAADTLFVAARGGELSYQAKISLTGSTDFIRPALVQLVKATYQRP